MRVLIVDDDPLLRLIARQILERQGQEVFEASDGQDAQMLLVSGLKVDAVVSDYQMPFVTGVELLRWIRENPNAEIASLRVVIVTGETAGLGKITEAVMAYDASLVLKPYTKHQLLEKLGL